MCIGLLEYQVITNSLIFYFGANRLVTDWRQVVFVLLTLHISLLIYLDDLFPLLIAEQNYVTDCCVNLP